MKTQRITLPIFDLSCGGGGVLIIERALARTPSTSIRQPRWRMSSMIPCWLTPTAS